MPGTYQIDSGLVHKILLSIMASIICVGGYMIVWAYLDARWKGELDVKMEQIQRYMIKLDDHIAKPCHDVACERIKGLQKHSEGRH